MKTTHWEGYEFKLHGHEVKLILFLILKLGFYFEIISINHLIYYYKAVVEWHSFGNWISFDVHPLAYDFCLCNQDRFYCIQGVIEIWRQDKHHPLLDHTQQRDCHWPFGMPSMETHDPANEVNLHEINVSEPTVSKELNPIGIRQDNLCEQRFHRSQWIEYWDNMWMFSWWNLTESVWLMTV